MTKSPIKLSAPVVDDPKHHIRLYQGDCLELLPLIPESSVDLIFADPPYFLSNGGITCHAGRMVSVNKGEWDKSKAADANHEFNRVWLAACQRVLKPNGSLYCPCCGSDRLAQFPGNTPLLIIVCRNVTQASN